MKVRMKSVFVLTTILALSGLAPAVAIAQHGMPGGTPMTFFVTSEPIGDGGNLGGLAGADAYCQKLATAVGAGNRAWHAYLSTQARPGQSAVNARDLAHLHGDTLELARRVGTIR